MVVLTALPVILTPLLVFLEALPLVLLFVSRLVVVIIILLLALPPCAPAPRLVSTDQRFLGV